MDHKHEKHDAQEFDRSHWEARYAGPGLIWSGNPNPVLVTEAATLSPGRALDVGSGEGGDAIWLARRGWRVTGVDIADNALAKARAQAESVDRDAAARIDWQQHDFTAWTPAPASFDLVSSHYMHLPRPARAALFRALAAAVAPGGTLLIVGHAPSDLGTATEMNHHRLLMFEADEVVNAISGEKLTVEFAGLKKREKIVVHGDTTMAHDVVVRARRDL